MNEWIITKPEVFAIRYHTKAVIFLFAKLPNPNQYLLGHSNIFCIYIYNSTIRKRLI